jgi:signal transduction histidine kinase/CheY-like chemotaxis protein
MRANAPFNVDAWRQALAKFGAVTRMTVVVFDDRGQVVCGPVPATPLFTLFDEFGRAPEILSECASQCLAQRETRPAVIVAPSYGLAVVGTSLVLDDSIVGAAVAGYALVDFVQPSAIEGLARAYDVPFKRLWSVALQQQPVSQAKLVVHGELLQVLGDTILKENFRTRQFEETAARLEREMSAKDEFLAVLSHELRTPLTPLLTWVDIMKRDSSDPAQRRRAFESIERNGKLQVKLIDDLLDLNRIIRGKVPLDLGTHELSPIVEAALDTMAHSAAEKRIGVEVTGDTRPMPVEADATRLQQVFANILSNAVKFSPAGARIEVQVEQGASQAIVRVIDFGEGIAPEFVPHVFDMFRQQEEGTRRKHAGLGIGLALVKRLVEMQGGSVEVVSAGAGRGTEVTVRLPLVSMQSESGVAGSMPSRDEPLALDRITILVVEDTEDTREPMRLLLEEHGAHVLEAGNGSQALAVLAAHRADVVLCDLRMPVMDGFEFMRALARDQGADHPPVVAISGLASKGDHEKTREAGFEAHLSKPFDFDALVSTVQTTIGRRKSA